MCCDRRLCVVLRPVLDCRELSGVVRLDRGACGPVRVLGLVRESSCVFTSTSSLDPLLTTDVLTPFYPGGVTVMAHRHRAYVRPTQAPRGTYHPSPSIPQTSA